jgi:hypothetical protein
MGDCSVFDCKNVPHSDGPNPDDALSCQCTDDLTWITDQCAKDCTDVSNSHKTFSSSDVTQCDCLSGWSSDKTYGDCVIPDCFSLPHTNGTVSDVLQCQCENGFMWDTNQCGKDCTNVAHSTKTFLTADVAHC